MAKYSVGQIVWFYGQAGSTDDIFSYPCIGRGKITKIYEKGGPYAREGVTGYSMQNSGGYLVIKESDIYPDSPDKAIERLNQNWESEWDML